MPINPFMHNGAKKLLLVDSNNVFRESLRTFITSLGDEVIAAASGPEAIAKTTTIHPDLIIMNLRLRSFPVSAYELIFTGVSALERSPVR